MKISDNNSLIKTTCISLADSMGPNLQEAFSKLDLALAGSSDKDTLWSLTVAAELASRLGKDEQAKIYYQKALKLYPNDVYLLSSYSDYLIKHGQYKEVINLLKNKTQHDNLLLRLAIAEQVKTEHAKELETRFKAAHLRGDKRHQREEAIYHLEVTHDYKKALSLAKSNFQVQKELIDIELLKKATEKITL